ncbi:uncharacterized protein MONBRDRAFT_33989 [Monosiga brevicollis MX1]|uniref:RNA helicase n=1 Tax=Monosiga brevicollis TaxID=81824 RepID=A9V8Y7_MONBE|nr:uncharacterized protein MONBRDRAFT_33989 [Monosiga brevicollis MX1]EDQ85958.1 predicted protein [Monosiga brevicollis MX1]|eukprot:XP_001749152.1 hypothetical protein [Monosiga brevicollis MX1]
MSQNDAFHMLTAGLRVRRPASSTGMAAQRGKKSSMFTLDTTTADTDSSQEDVAALRKRHRIHVRGSDVPAPVTSFAQLGKPAAGPAASSGLLQALTEFFKEPSPIQMQAIPALLSNRDVVGVAPTGSGKTLAFAVPMMQLLQAPKEEGFRCCILAPTRELAAQIKRELDLLNTHLHLKISLLTKARAASGSLTSSKKHGWWPGCPKMIPVCPKVLLKLTWCMRARPDILVATPMRLVHALQHKLVDLSAVRWLVVDEADRLFENGFEQQIDEVIAACSHKKRRIALFSATMPERVETLAQTVLHDYVRIVVGAANAANQDVEQELKFVGSEEGKMTAIRQMLQTGLQPPVLIFVQSKSRAQQLFEELVYENVNVDVIHADRTQQQRDEVVKRFREGQVWVLICTDLMGRGVDFKAVNVVINYDFPPNATEYIHRVGRTGRAGHRGRAVTFFTVDDRPMLRNIANVVKASGSEVPEWMLKLKKTEKQRSRQIERAPVSSNPNVQAADKKTKAKRAQKASDAGAAPPKKGKHRSTTRGSTKGASA